MTTRRRALTDEAKHDLWQRQGMRCAGYCARPTPLADMDADHIHALWCGGGNENSNFQLLCHPCHDEKTFLREAGARAKMNRLEHIRLFGRKPKVSKIEGRGFSKVWRRLFGGKVELRK